MDAEGIVKLVAKECPWCHVNGATYHCTMCKAIVDGWALVQQGEGENPFVTGIDWIEDASHHEGYCPWRLAVEYVKGEEGSSGS